MASPVNASQAWVDEFRSRFGASPDSHKLELELARSIQLGQELLAERERLRAQVARLQGERDQYLRCLSAYLAKAFPRVELDKEAIFAEMDKEPTLDQLIAELERGMEN